MTDVLDELVHTLETRRVVLFTGAGFSRDARDVDGRPLPDSIEMARELWTMCFGDGPPDDSSLADLYDVALRTAPDQLRAYASRRLRIGSAPLPPHLARWFSVPWRRIYTLNVDELEVAVAKQFALPHRFRTISATAGDAPGDDDSSTIDVVHLNGLASEGAAELTFSTMQYAARLCGQDREYSRLAADLIRAPFVFAGTTLDEVVLWQHVEMRRRHAGREPRTRAPSFLVSSSLSRARQELLRHLGIHWVQASIAEVASALPITERNRSTA